MSVDGSRSPPIATRSPSTDSARSKLQRAAVSGTGGRFHAVRSMVIQPALLPGAKCATLGDVADQQQGGTNVKERAESKTKEPELYGVVLLNDDYTPMAFVTD